jgi:hypothetical protein
LSGKESILSPNWKLIGDYHVFDEKTGFVRIDEKSNSVGYDIEKD